MSNTARRRWFQFSIFGLLVLVTLVATFCALVVIPARRKHHAVEQIQALGGFVRYDFEWSSTPWPELPTPRGPAWLRAIVGDDYFQTVVDVTVESHTIPAQHLRPFIQAVMQFPELDGLCLISDSLNDDDVKQLSKMTSLKSLILASNSYPTDPNTAITDVGVSYLANLTRLEYLTVEGSFTDNALLSLSHLTELKFLELRAPVTDAGMVHLHSLRKLEKIICSNRRDADCLDSKYFGDHDSEEIPLTDMFDYFASVLDMECSVDVEKIGGDQSGLSDVKITLHTKKGTPPRDVIDQMLNPLGLGFRIQENRLIITTRAEGVRAHAGIDALREKLPNLQEVEVTW
ncbi:MAG TPA: hypothetical protein VGN12_06245 [Pirellulales bacterium]|jgi:hypothetical protein